uniref:AarF domain-containing protein kinase 4 n=1 Tax=Hirondellea gigas TaxID=1518452 RepID=A0A6A7FM85_9CRUS
MDPTITELDLEKILGSGEKNEDVQESAEFEAPDVLNNMDFGRNPRLKRDLDEGGDILINSDLERVAQGFVSVMTDVRDNLEDTYEKTRDGLESLAESVSIQAALPDISPAEQQKITDSIEESLQSLRGSAFITRSETTVQDKAVAEDVVEVATASTDSPDPLSNFDFSFDNKLKKDLDVGAEFLKNRDLDRVVRGAANVIDDVRDDFESQLERTREKLDDMQSNASEGSIHELSLAEQEHIADSIEQKLQSLRGEAFTADLGLIEQQGRESAHKTESVLREAVKTQQDSVLKATAAVATSKVGNRNETLKLNPTPKLLGRKPLAKDKPESLLSSSSKARRVPDTRLSRLVSFGSLAAGLGVGTLAEMTRRRLGIGQNTDPNNPNFVLDSSPILSQANANRIVDTLCKVRGAALKLGQMMSLQDNTMINPQLQQIFERVRQSADFLPHWQLQRVMQDELGPEWQGQFASFDEKPFAAASIGQVHEGVLHDGRRVAVKVQYPGVAEGIDSDINNLLATLNVANVLPQGMFVESVITVAKRELAWECDYVRERACGERYATLVAPYPQYYVPASVPHLSTRRVLTTELIEGVAVDKCIAMDQATRNTICSYMLELTLRELFQFGYMQTDPNWANFFYNETTQQIALVDFGACREYKKSFVDVYIEIIHGAAIKDREKIVKYSREIGFLTGHEPKIMVEAHTDAIMILGEAFLEDRVFSFSQHNTTRRIQKLLPTMLQHRMCPPPEEIYSLHRKMSGVFLLCSRLSGETNLHPLFFELYRNYKYGGDWPTYTAHDAATTTTDTS